MHLPRHPATRLAGVAAAILLVAACAQAPKPVTVTETVAASATVESIDQAKRLLRLRTVDGRTLVMQVGPGVQNFNQMRVGDRVTVRYTEAIAAEVVRPGTGVTTTLGPAPTVERAAPGGLPGGTLSATMKGVVKIQSVDTANNVVTIVGSDGVPRPIRVVDAKAQEFIRGLKVGDEVQLTFSEAVAVSVEHAR
jgi:hypothetical protein